MDCFHKQYFIRLHHLAAPSGWSAFGDASDERADAFGVRLRITLASVTVDKVFVRFRSEGRVVGCTRYAQPGYERYLWGST